PVYMAGLDVTEKALVTAPDVQRIKEIGNPVSEIVWKWLEFFYQFHKSIGYEGAPMHDACAVMVLIHPELFELKDMYVKVDLQGEFTRGQTVGDYYGVTGKKPNATCLMNIDRQKFIDYMVEYIEAYTEGTL
ncbi:MAG: nucleoside hydrolase, partial [Erysipelotrichaceae bacterium]|nr:nucleoside hydrolase [Erysipelotrichaceae bacterium]